ncbi:MAG: cation:proton antiporter [Clostridiales bacterium]|nr:cation:proton antiporter [Clostridiales bacterium]
MLSNEQYGFIIDLAVILLSTKLLGLLTRKIQMPQVVGALLAGLILGPACLGILKETSFIKSVSEIGVIVLMFSAGMETDIQELRKTGLASFIVAMLGVLVPLGGGFLLMRFFNKGSDAFIQNLFIGVVLTATSVSITVETLKEMGKLSTKSGNAILGAALIDDVLGIIALTIITSAADPRGTSIAFVLIKILLFFVFCAVVAVLFVKFIIPKINSYKKDLRRFSILAFAFCLIMSFSAEYFFGVSDITGAFIAGLILSTNRKTTYMLHRFETVSYLLLSPVFFAGVGLQVELGGMNGTLIIASLLLLLVAVITKIVGCGVGAKLMGFGGKQSLQIGVGMISRGEVALIVASKGAAVTLASGASLMLKAYFAPLIIVVVVTTIITPILLKLVYRGDTEVGEESAIAEKIEEPQYLEHHAQEILNIHEDMKEQLKKK